MMQSKYCRLIPCVTIMALGGCATVNPSGDFDRVGEHIQEATGLTNVYRPGEEEIVAARVAELLGDGLTVGEAVQVCLLNNRALQADFLNVGIARANVVQSGLLSNPSLGVSLRLPAGGGLANFEAGLAQNIAELWQIPFRKRAAERSLDRAILQLAHDAGVLATDVKAAYLRAVAADRKLAIARENLDIVRRLLGLTLARQEAGVGTEVDVNLSRSEMREVELVVRSTTLATYEFRSQLVTLLGLVDAPDELALVDPLPDPPNWTLTSDRLLEAARVWRLDLRAARRAVEEAAARVEYQRSRVFPSLELGLAMERGERAQSKGGDFLADTISSSVAAGAPTFAGFDPQGHRPTDFIIGPSISLELPIFDQNQAGIATAEYGYIQSVKLLDSMDLGVMQETRLVHERAKTAWETARFYRDRVVPLRETNLNLAHEAYKAGKASFLSVLEAQRTLLSARAGYVEAMEMSAVSLPEMERVTGQPIAKLLTPEATHNDTLEKGE